MLWQLSFRKSDTDKILHFLEFTSTKWILQYVGCNSERARVFVLDKTARNCTELQEQHQQ